MRAHTSACLASPARCLQRLMTPNGLRSGTDRLLRVKAKVRLPSTSAPVRCFPYRRPPFIYPETRASRLVLDSGSIPSRRPVSLFFIHRVKNTQSPPSAASLALCGACNARRPHGPRVRTLEGRKHNVVRPTPLSVSCSSAPGPAFDHLSPLSLQRA